MVKPVLLVDTGITYEEANIQRWLLTKNTCPVTHEVLTSKQLKPNYAIQGVILEWAQANKVTLPPAPVCEVPLEVGGTRSGRSMTASAASSSSVNISDIQRSGVSSYTAVTIGTTSGGCTAMSYGTTTSAGMAPSGTSSTGPKVAARPSAVNGDVQNTRTASARSHYPAGITSKCVVDGDEERVVTKKADGGLYGRNAGIGPSAAGFAMGRRRCATSKTCWAITAIAVVAVLGVVVGVAVYVSRPPFPGGVGEGIVCLPLGHTGEYSVLVRVDMLTSRGARWLLVLFLQ
jgi:hypothetical protein